MRGSRLVRLVAVATVVSAGTAVPAVAAGPPPPAIAQYVEVIPAAGGDAVAGYAKPHFRPLPNAVERKITQQAGSQAPVLTAIAGSSVYGAPQSKLRLTHRAAKPKSSPKKTGTHPDTSVERKLRAATASSAGTLSGGSGGSSLLVLGIAVAVVTVLLAAARFGLD
jgi:hypothetical protein